MTVESAPLHYKSISRIDQARKRTHGWYVRVIYKDDRVSKFFSDGVYGGKEDALAEALAFRDETERRLKKPRTDRPVVRRSRRTTAGMIGVRRIMKRSQSRTGVITVRPVYEVTWSPEKGVLRRTSISIEKHGETAALRKAQALRRAKEREMYGLKPRVQRPEPTPPTGE